MSDDLFISYTTRDKNIVKYVLESLDKEFISYWFAPRDIKAGEDHNKVIIPAIKKAKIFIVFLSKHTRPYGINDKDISEYVLTEVTVARREKKYIIPIMLDETVRYPTSDVQFERLGNYIDFYRNSKELASKQLVNLLKELLTDDNYLTSTIDDYRKALEEANLEILKEIEKNIKAQNFNTSLEMIDKNSLLAEDYNDDVKLYKTIIMMSMKSLKDLNHEEIKLIYESLTILENSKYENYVYYLKAMILESYFKFNAVYNDITSDTMESLKLKSKQTNSIKTREFKLFRGIKTTNPNFEIDWILN